MEQKVQARADRRAAPGEDEQIVLLVEDDPDVQEMVAHVLRRDGFSVICADSLSSAEEHLRSADVMVALVDLTLRDGNGLELVRRLSFDPTISTVIMSGQSDEMDRIIGLEVGADDYVTKPFNHRELTVRLRRHASRIRLIREQAGLTGAGPAPRNVVDRWTIDEARRAVLDEEGNRADLSDAEFRTLMCFAYNRGNVLSRDELYREVVGPGARDPLDRRIDVYVSGLRKKLALRAPTKIRTIHGVGYILD